MANTLATVMGGVTDKADQIGLVVATLTTTETYATPTGISVDFTALWTQLGIRDTDVVRVNGRATTGHLAVTTKTGSGDIWTMRLWNGATEIADGALNHTVQLEIFYHPGQKP